MSDKGLLGRAIERVTNAFSSDKHPDQPCEQCKTRHFLDVTLEPRPYPVSKDVDKKKLKPWPKDALKRYANEPSDASAVPTPKAPLDGSGHRRVDGLPEGIHSVEFADLVSSARKHALSEASKEP